MKKILLKDLKKGDLFFKTDDCRESRLLVRDHYDRTTQRYAYHYYYDYNREGFLKGNTFVFVES